jgi:hypothetical protein
MNDEEWPGLGAVPRAALATTDGLGRGSDGPASSSMSRWRTGARHGGSAGTCAIADGPGSGSAKLGRSDAARQRLGVTGEQGLWRGRGWNGK